MKKTEFCVMHWSQIFNESKSRWKVENSPPMTDLLWSASGYGFPGGCFICENQEQAEKFAADLNEVWVQCWSNRDECAERTRQIFIKHTEGKPMGDKQFWVAVCTRENGVSKWGAQGVAPLEDIMWWLKYDTYAAYICETRKQAEALAAECNKAIAEYPDSEQCAEKIREIIKKYRTSYPEWRRMYGQ